MDKFINIIVIIICLALNFMKNSVCDSRDCNMYIPIIVDLFCVQVDKLRKV